MPIKTVDIKIDNRQVDSLIEKLKEARKQAIMLQEELDKVKIKYKTQTDNDHE